MDGVVEKDVEGETVYRFRRLKDPEYFLPKELVEDEERMKIWSGKVRWGQKRNRLPKGFQDHVFAKEIAEDTGTNIHRLSSWATSRPDGDMGVTLDLEGKPQKAKDRKRGDGTLIFSPEDAEVLRSHFTKRTKVKEDYVSVNKLADRLEIGQQMLQRWVRRNWLISADKETNIFGLDVQKFQDGTYIKDDIDPDLVKKVKIGNFIDVLQ